ncbi:MAG: Na/Pi cotransporter family protein [Calditrichia bacterium]
MQSELIFKLIFSLAGGLGIFLLGMKNMQQGLQVIAGPRIRQGINRVTSNRFLAVGIGAFVTMLVQSSSVTSVMVIGLVNSQLMALSSAIGVIMGANIGTTITGWILALKIGKYGLPLLGFSAFGWLFLKQEKARYIFLAIMGIGMVFFGLEIMKDGFKPVKDLPWFEQAFHMFEATSYLGVLKAALVGCVLTIIVQSSSATLGITIALASTGVIDFATAGALVLGENIGTTITAYLASLGADDINAKRTAYFHIFFNVLGCAWITLIYLGIYLPALTTILEFIFPGFDLTYQDPDGTFTWVTVAISSVHSGFNIINTLLFIGFIPFFANFLEKYVNKERGSRSDHLTHLEFKEKATPVTAIERSRQEILRTDKHVKTMLENLKLAITLKKPDKKQREEVIKLLFEREEIIDDVQKEITTFLTAILSEQISSETAKEGRSQLRLIDEYESVSDDIVDILKLYLRLRSHTIKLSKRQRTELLGLHTSVSGYFDLVHAGLVNGPSDYLNRIRLRSNEINEEVRTLRDTHWQRLSEEQVEPLVSTTYMDIANSYRRMKDHLLNIGEAIHGEEVLSDRHGRPTEN